MTQSLTKLSLLSVCLLVGAWCASIKAENRTIDISGNNTSSSYVSYDQAITLPSSDAVDVKMARYCYFSSTIKGSGQLNLYAGGERCYLGTAKGASWPDWTGFTGRVDIYPFKENSSSAGFYGVVLAHGGKAFSAADIEGGLSSGKVNKSMENNRVTLHDGATICCEAHSTGSGFRIGELQTEAGSSIIGYMKKNTRAAHFLVGCMNTDATLAGTIAPPEYSDTHPVGIIKEGTGTYRLTGNQNYLSGALRVLGGRMLIMNDRAEAEQKKMRGAVGAMASETDAVAYVFEKGVLGGTGHIGGTVDNYGTIEPGADAVGTLTLCNYVTTSKRAHLYVRPASVLRFKLASTSSHDLLSVSGKVKYYNIAQDFSTSDKMPLVEVVLTDGADVKVGDEFTVLTAKGKDTESGDWHFDLKKPQHYTWEVVETVSADAYTVSLRLVSLEDQQGGSGGDDDPTVEDDPTGPFYDDGFFEASDLTSLRDYAAQNGKFIGTALSTWKNNISNESLAETKEVAAQFNMLVAENEMKFDALEPSRGQFSYGSADQLVNFAQKHDITMRGHCLAWHSQLPTWVSSDGYKNDKNWSREEALDILRTHITNVVNHYKGKVAEWDVVNECLDDNQTSVWSNPNGYDLRSSVWIKAIGEDFIDSAFVFAHRADPSAVLYLNDYGVELQGKAKSMAFYNLAVRLKKSQIPIDGVGLQCHFSVGDVDSVKLASTIRKFADAGLKCIITELDMGIGSTSDDDLEQQALNYRVITDIVLDNDNCPNMVIWGLKDNDSWRSGSSPLLYDANLTKKPAYYAVRSALRHRTLDPSTTTGQVFVLDEKFTRLADMVGKSFAVVNDDEGKALYGPSEQNLAYDDVATALSRSNAVICFKLEKRGGSNFLLRGMTPQGWEYSVWDKPGYLNSQPADGWCSFILGLNDQYGEDMKDGAVWTIRYTDGQGFSLLNRGTGKYLHDASPAKYDDPVYFNFYTIKRSSTVGIASQTVSGSKPLSVAYYDLNGRRVGADARGLIIRRTVMSDGSTLVEKMIR